MSETELWPHNVRAQIADFVRRVTWLFSLTLRKNGISAAEEGCCDRFRGAFRLGDAALSINFRRLAKLLLERNKQIKQQQQQQQNSKLLENEGEYLNY